MEPGHTGRLRGVNVTAAGECTDPSIPLVSVVIPARNAATTLGIQLDALSRQDFTGTWEVVLADNGSTDATVAVATSYRHRVPSLRIVSASERPGVNHARNIGVAATRSPLLCFCDADDRVRTGWLRELVAALERYDLVGGRRDLDALNDGAPGQRSNGSDRPTRSRPPLAPPVSFLPYPLGANCAIRRQVWERIGGFDESFRGGGDEIDFFWRAQVAGYRFGEAPTAVIDYRLPGDLRTAMRRGFIKGRASARLYRKFAEHGARFRPAIAARSWLGLWVRSYRLFGRRPARQAWLIRLAQQTGRVAGGLQHRRLYF